MPMSLLTEQRQVCELIQAIAAKTQDLSILKFKAGYSGPLTKNHFTIDMFSAILRQIENDRMLTENRGQWLPGE
jgi:hypothetical protein